MTQPFSTFAFPTSLAGSVARTALVRASDVINVKDYGATGNGSTDDTVAINAAIAAALAVFSWSGNQNANINDTLGARATVYIPAGTYLVSAALTTLDVPIALKGDGSFASILLVATSFSGTLISYNECWGAFLSTGTPQQKTRNGPHIEGLTILGQNSTNTQHAIVFQNRNDMVYMRDVTVYNMSGWGLALGTVGPITQAYVRESHFRDLRFFGCGSATFPVIEIGTIGNGDRTNTCYWSGIDIFQAAGDGLAIRSTATNASAADTQFFDYLRIESPGGNGIKLGDSGYTGRVSNNAFDKVLLFGIPSGNFGIVCYNNANANLNYENRIAKCDIGGGSAGGGINIVGARDFYFQGDISTTQANITVGPTSGGSGGNLIFDLFNNTPTTSIDASATNNVYHPTLTQGSA